MGGIESPIGVFDSGLGGLTSLRMLTHLCPGEDILYFGDTGRLPYGTKSARIVRRYALQDARFLCSFGVKAILVACGTVSSTAMDALTDALALPVLGVLDPACEAAARIACQKGGKVLVLGTEATVEAGSYERALQRIDPQLTVLSKACPMFVPLVENGYTGKDEPISYAIAREYLSSFAAHRPDAIILGCTHYPLLKDAIGAALPGVALIDAGEAAACAMAALLRREGLARAGENGRVSLYVSDCVRNFEKMASAFLAMPVPGVTKIDIEAY